MGTCDSPDNDDRVVLRDPSTMASAIPGVATDVPGTGTPLAGGGGVETSGTSDNALGLEVLLIGVMLVLFRRRKTASYFVCYPCYQLIQCSWREGDGLWLNWSCAGQGSRLVSANHIG